MRLEQAQTFIENLQYIKKQSKNEDKWNLASVTQIATECFQCILKECSQNQKLVLLKKLSKGLGIYSNIVNKASSQFSTLQQDISFFIGRHFKNTHPLKSPDIAKIIGSFLSVKDCEKMEGSSEFDCVKESILKPLEGLMGAYKLLSASNASNENGLLSNNIDINKLETYSHIQQIHQLRISAINTRLLKWDQEKALKELPEKIYLWKNLNGIYASNQGLKHLKDSIGKVSKLNILQLENNKLTKLPESIGSLNNLLHLNLSGNPLNSLPQSMNKLKNLSTLNLKRTKLTEQTKKWIKESLPDCIIEFEDIDLEESNKQKKWCWWWC